MAYLLKFIDRQVVREMAANGDSTQKMADHFGITKRNFLLRKKKDDLLRHEYDAGRREYGAKHNLFPEIEDKNHIPRAERRRLQEIAVKNPVIGTVDFLLRYDNKMFHEITTILAISDDTLCDVMVRLVLDMEWVKPLRNESDEVVYQINENARPNIIERWQKLGAKQQEQRQRNQIREVAATGNTTNQPMRLAA